MYESTIQALDSLYHKLSPGGFTIIDETTISPTAAWQLPIFALAMAALSKSLRSTSVACSRANQA
jgi:hypothetical protein